MSPRLPFEPLVSNQLPRRAFLLMPIAFAGLAAFCYPRERDLPDPARDGDGPEIKLILFSASGKAISDVHVRKLIRTAAYWRAELTGEQYAITRRKGTEFAFANRYWNRHDPGIYRCVCCGNALFRSEDKFDSGTGWPSFSLPIAAENVYTKLDSNLSVRRTEVLCRKCDAHEGHVFDDGPAPSGLRYCLNSAALRFVKYA